MNRTASVITKKLLAILLLLVVGFLPAFGQVNALQPSAKKPALATPARHPGAIHRRKHRRRRRRHLRRVRRRIRRHRRALNNKNTPNNTPPNTTK